MKTNEERIAELEGDLQSNKPKFELMEQLERLFKNKDFQELILDGYLRDEAVRLVHEKASAQFASAEGQFKILRDIDAIGSLQQYFRTIKMEGEHAKQNLIDAETELESILGEQE